MRRIGCACLLLIVTAQVGVAQQGRFLSRQSVRGLFRGKAPLLVPHRSANSMFNVTDFWQPEQSDEDWESVASPTLQLVEAELDPMVAPAPITFADPEPIVQDELTPAPPIHQPSKLTESPEVFQLDTPAPPPSRPEPANEPIDDLTKSEGTTTPQIEQLNEGTQENAANPTEPDEAEPGAATKPEPVEEPLSQTAASPVTTQPPATTTLTEHDIHERLAELESKPQNSNTIAQADLFKQALMWLAAAEKAKTEADRLQNAARSVPEQMFDATAALDEVTQQQQKNFTGLSIQQLESAAQRVSILAEDLSGEHEKLNAQIEVIARRMADPGSQRKELLASLRSAEQLITNSGATSNPATLVEAQARARMLRNQLALTTVHAHTDSGSRKLLEAQLAVVDARLKAAREQKAKLETAADATRKREAAEQAARAKKLAEQVPEALKPFADENAIIAEQLKWIKDHLGETRRLTTEAETITGRLSKSFDRVRKTQERTGLNTTLGLILNHELEHLPSPRVWQRRISGIKDQLHELSELEFDVERRKGALEESKVQVATIVASLSAQQPARAEAIRRIGDQLTTSRNSLLDETEKAARSYSEDLTTFDAKCEELVDTIHSFESHIQKNVLWIRSDEPLSVGDFAAFGQLATNISDSKMWFDTANSILVAIRESLAPLAVVSFLLLVVLSFGDELRTRLRRTGELCTEDNHVQLRPTLEAIAITWLLGSAWPLFFWSLGWSISQSLGATDTALAIAYALQTSALWWGAFSLPRAICTQDGLGHRHFGWPEAALKSVFRGLPTVMTWGLPVVAVVAFLSTYDHAKWSASVGRIAFILGVVWLAFFMRRALNTESGLVAKWSRGNGWLHRSRHVIAAIGFGIPIVFALTSAAGYHHSSLRLSRCLQETWMLTVGLLVAHGILGRCVERVMQSFEEGKPVVAFPFRARVIHPNSKEADAATHAIELATNREQVQRFLQFGTVITAILCCWGIWHNVLPALNVVNDVQLWSMTRDVVTPATADGIAQTARTSVPVTLGDLIRAIMVLVITIVASRNLPGLLETFVLLRLPFDRGGRHAISTICRYVLTTVGLLLTLRQVGIDWASMQWMVAAMTVGLGFGLQEIFANFVSGLIILLERPIRLGDFVTVNGETGFVTRIQFRATTITDLDRRELLVPNKKFITDELINWTLSDPITRLVLPIGIAYGSDTTEAHKLLVEVAEEHPIVLKEPEPSAVMMAFGDSTLNFELRVFIPRRDEFAQILHELNTAIDRKFRSANIEIAFPQCDINVRGLEQLTALAAKRAA